MRSSVVPAGLPARRGTGGGTAAAGAAAAALSLPLLGDAALCHYRTRAGGEAKLAALGLGLVDGGLLKASDARGDLFGAVHAALGRWLDRVLGPLEHVDLRATLFADVFAACDTDGRKDFADRAGGDHHARQAVLESCGIDLDEPHLAVALHPATRAEVLVADAVQALNDEFPGLGWEALHAVCDASARWDFLGPQWLDWAASWCYWGGMDDEVAWAEETGEPVEDVEFTREVLEAVFPVRALNAHRHLGQRELARIAASGQGLAARVAALVGQLRRSRRTGQGFNIGPLAAALDWQDSMEAAGLIGWKSFEGIYRIGDDYFNAMQGGDVLERPYTVVFGLPLCPGGLARQELAWRLPARRLRLMDRLLGLLAAPQ